MRWRAASCSRPSPPKARPRSRPARSAAIACRPRWSRPSRAGVRDGSIRGDIGSPMLMSVTLWGFMHGIIQLTTTKAHALAHHGVAPKALIDHAISMITRDLKSLNSRTSNMDCLRSRLDMRPATQQLRVVAGCRVGCCAGVCRGVAQAQESPTPGRPLAAVIDEYVREGLASNLSLRAQSLEVERAAAALDEARARYFPEVGLAARYSRSEGGRTIDLPLGTMR